MDASREIRRLEALMTKKGYASCIAVNINRHNVYLSLYYAPLGQDVFDGAGRGRISAEVSGLADALAKVLAAAGKDIEALPHADLDAATKEAVDAICEAAAHLRGMNVRSGEIASLIGTSDA